MPKCDVNFKQKTKYNTSFTIFLLYYDFLMEIIKKKHKIL